MSDRRKGPRHTVDLLANRYNRGAARPIRVTELSDGGLRVDDPGPLVPRGLVSIELDLPGDRPVWMFCRAVRHAEGKTGLVVVGMDSRDEAAFASYLSSLPTC